VNRLPSRRPARRPGPQAVLFLLLLAALPGAAFTQKRAAPPPVATPDTPSPDAGPSLALGQKEALSQKQMLDADKRLNRLISLDVISVPLNEVLQKESLDKSTETMEDAHRFLLTASSDCTDLKLQIRLNNRPLRVLMTALAQMLPGAWTRTPHGYQLAMTKQAADARAEWWRLFLGEREKALALQRQAVLAAMQTKPQRRPDGGPDPEQSDRAVEADVANQHDFFHSLPPALKEQIAANMEETAFYEMERVGFSSDEERFGTVGWLSQMSPETQEKFKAAMQDYINNHLAPAPPAYQKYAVQAQKDLAAFDPSKVYFLFQNGGGAVLAIPFNAPPSASTILDMSVPMTVSTPLLMLDQKQLAAEVYGGRLVGPHWERLANTVRKMGDAAPPEMKMLVYDVYGMGEAAPPEWKRLAAYQRGRVWPNVLLKLPPEDHHTWHPAVSRAAQTDWLGERGHMEYVSDYYSHGGYAMPPEQRKLPVKRPLAAELDEMAAKRDVSWTKDAAGIYLVRNNRWYRDDALEVPQPLLRRWFGAVLQARRQEVTRRQEAAQAAPQATVQATGQAAPQLPPQSPEERTAILRQKWDWAAEAFATLTPWQIRNGLSLFQPEEKDLAPQNDATAAKMFEGMKRQVPNGIVPPGYDAFANTVRMPPFYMAINTLKGFPHTMQLYGSLDAGGRTALLEGRLPASALSASQVAQAVALQPQLPQALQNFPADSILLGFNIHPSVQPDIASWDSYQMRLEVSTPPRTP